jgi:hypothetical protein
MYEEFKSYWWLFILVILAILVCIFIKSPERIKKEPREEEPERIKETSRFVPIQNNKSSYYDKLNSDLNIAVQQIKKKAQEARHIIHDFPEFPDIWLLHTNNKGEYGSIPERYCIEFLHLLFPGYTFIKKKHSFLRNPKTNYPLELDGYCEELMIALEYNGIQHYVWPNFYHSKVEDFFSQRDRDQIKEDICKKRNICLIRIPYTVSILRIPLAIYAKLLEAVPGLEL